MEGSNGNEGSVESDWCVCVCVCVHVTYDVYDVYCHVCSLHFFSISAACYYLVLLHCWSVLLYCISADVGY